MTLGEPVKLYEPRPFTPAALRLALPGVLLMVLVHVLTGLIMVPAIIVVSCFALGIACYFDVFAGRAWLALYDDRLEIQGPLSRLMKWWAGVSLGKTAIPYERIEALGRSEYEGKGSFLVIHRGRGLRQRKFFVPCEEHAQYLDLREQLLRRVPPRCKLYMWKGFGRKGPFIW